jgi:hypothetical protein
MNTVQEQVAERLVGGGYEEIASIQISAETNHVAANQVGSICRLQALCIQQSIGIAERTDAK